MSRKFGFLRVVLASLLLASGLQVQAQDDNKALIEDVAEALGMLRGPDFNRVLDPINRALFVGTGTATRLGEDGDWHDYQLVNFRQDMSYHIPAIRQHVSYINEEGEEGTAFLVARGDLAWNEESLGMGATPVEGAAASRIREVSITPHGFFTHVVRANPEDVTVGKRRGKTTISTMINGEKATAVLGDDMRPERITIEFEHPQLGDTELVADYSGYQDFNHYLVFFPTHIEHRLDGRKVLELDISDHHNGGYLVWPVPESMQVSSSH